MPPFSNLNRQIRISYAKPILWGLGHAKAQFDVAVADARREHEAASDAKIERTRYLASVNPLVNEQDVVKAEMQAEMQRQAWDDVELQPVGVRMILCAPPGTV